MTEKDEALQQLLVSVVAGEGFPGCLLGVSAPDEGLAWSGAAGVANLSSAQPLDSSHGFRIASMSKTFTGVLCLLLEERGLLRLQAPALAYLPAGTAAALRDVLGEPAGEVTVDRLLQHRAGFADFALSPAWFAELAADPGRPRLPEEIAAWAVAHGGQVAAPGERFCYSDTGYVLLGLLLQEVGGAPYDELCRSHIFEPLAMENTFLEGNEAPRGTVAHCYATVDGERVDAMQIHGSCDWAAGGHVSTLEDLHRFQHGCLAGALFRREATLERFLYCEPVDDGYRYGYGLSCKRFGGQWLYGHLGHWGSFMRYLPERGLSIVGCYLCDAEHQNLLTAEVLSLLQR